MRFFKRLKHIFIPHHGNAYRPHLLRRRSLMFLLGLALVAEALLVGNLALRQSGNDFLAAVIQSEIVALTNTERAQQKVATLAENELLNLSAQAKAEDMAAKGYFAHKSPDGSQPWVWIERAGYDYQYAGENLAVRFVDSKDVVVAWMASPTHRANIVKDKYTEIGVGLAQGIYKGEQVTFVVQHFAKPSAKALAARQQVLGAEVGPPATINDSIARSLGKLATEPRAATLWVLGGIAALLMLGLAFAFVHHVQIQSRDLLAPGAVVAAVALTLIAFNSNFLSSSISATNQSASAALAGQESGVVITAEAAALE